MLNVAYICDGGNCPIDSHPELYCRFMNPNNPCSHTTNIKHAKYGECKDPENHPERFEFIENGKKILYFEREI